MPPESAPVAGRREPQGILMWAAVPVIGLAAGYLGAQVALHPLREALATRPPVVILDINAALEGLAPAAASAAIARQQAAARRLADGGVLVLDGQSVLAAPAGATVKLDLELPPPDAHD